MAVGSTKVEQGFVAKSQGPPAPRPRVLTEFEEYIGVPLEPTEEAHADCPIWFWSWSLAQAKYFLGAWRDTKPMLVPMIRSLAMTTAPSYTVDGHWVASNQLLYEVACSTEVRQAIDQAEDTTGPTGSRTPYPHGDVIVDLICRVPGFRSDVYTINDHRFWGRGQPAPVNAETAKQLRNMHGNNEYEKLRVMQGYEGQVNLGELR